MKFGVVLTSRIGDYEIAREAEVLGYDSLWYGDAPMLWSDCYAAMALAAKVTTRIRLGTGVTTPSTRVAPVTAHSIASINQVAPGRVFLGIGVGDIGVRLQGQEPMRLREFEEYLRVVRALLRGEEVDYTQEGETHSIRMLNRGLGFQDLEHPIPIYLGANGPRALRLAGRCADGFVSSLGEDADSLRPRIALAEEGARASGRTLGADFHPSVVSNAIVLRAGEKLTDERIIEGTSTWVTTMMNWGYGAYARSGDEAQVPEFMHGVWEEFRDYVESSESRSELRYRESHEGYGSFCSRERRRFVTPEVIRACSLVAGASEIAEMLRASGAAGLREVSFSWPMALQVELMRDFAQVMKRL